MHAGFLPIQPWENGHDIPYFHNTRTRLLQFLKFALSLFGNSAARCDILSVLGSCERRDY